MKLTASCLLLLLAVPMLAAWELSLLHVNDIHARMEETNKHSSPCNATKEECYGGLARIATAVKKVQKEDQVSFVLLESDENIPREAMQLFGSTEETSSREPSGTQSSNGEWSQRFVEHSWILFNTILSFR